MAKDRKDKQVDRDTLVKDRTQRPSRHKVLLHNDDFTSMEFVIQVLESVFRKSPAEATRIMLRVHTSGIGLAGIYPFEIAEAKANRSISLARERGYPLLVTTEPE